MKTIPKVIAAVCGLLCFTASAANQPNIVFIMADDLGNADVGYHWSDIKTPNIVSRSKTVNCFS